MQEWSNKEWGQGKKSDLKITISCIKNLGHDHFLNKHSVNFTQFKNRCSGLGKASGRRKTPWEMG